jgi:hypothetical protein
VSPHGMQHRRCDMPLLPIDYGKQVRRIAAATLVTIAGNSAATTFTAKRRRQASGGPRDWKFARGLCGIARSAPNEGSTVT